jgi:hypothetical protein
MNKIAYLAMLAATAVAAPAVAQDAPVATQEGMEQFSPAQRFGYGLFLISQKFVEITSSPELEKNPDAAAEQIEQLTQIAYSLYEIPMTAEDYAELKVIQSKLMTTEEYNDIQSRGGMAANKIKAADYYGSERLKSAIRDFNMGVLGYRRG